MLVTGTLGSIHAFSIFVSPLEDALQAGRADISTIYSFALVTLTFAVLVGHRLYPRVASPLLAGGACAVAAGGLLLASTASSLVGLYLGYSLVFGVANGVGYGFVLQLVGQALPERRGLAMGLVTAVYALGAMLFARVFATLVKAGSSPADGVADAMQTMAIVLVVTAAVVAALLVISGARYRGEVDTREAATATAEAPVEPGFAWMAQLWFGYGFGVAAGLMAIAHAVGIVQSAGGSGEALVLGAMLIGLGNAIGGVVAGWMCDRYSIKALLVALPALSAAALVGLNLGGHAGIAIGLMCVIGFAYGAIISVYPAAISRYVGGGAAAKTYGRVFTAWGVAGLLAPWLAGRLFDADGNYSIALWIAAALALLSCVIASRYARPGDVTVSR